MQTHIRQRWPVCGGTLRIELETDRPVSRAALLLLADLTARVEADEAVALPQPPPERVITGLADARAALAKGRWA